MNKLITIEFNECSPLPANGYTVKYRILGSVGAYIDLGYYYGSPVTFIVETEDIDEQYEGIIQSDCGDGFLSNEIPFETTAAPTTTTTSTTTTTTTAAPTTTSTTTTTTTAAPTTTSTTTTTTTAAPTTTTTSTTTTTTTTIPSMQLVFDNQAGADAAMGGDSTNFADWNTFFDTGTNASTPFTSLVSGVDGNGDYYVNLFGCTDLFIADSLFSPGFVANTSIKKINDTIGSITSVGLASFFGCASISTLVAVNLATTGNSAFAGIGITSLDLPSLTAVANQAFGSSAVVSISLPQVTSVDSDGFSNCFNLTTIDSVGFPSLTTIIAGAFAGCTALASVSLPGVTSVGDYAFDFCPLLTTVDLSGATSIGAASLADNASLTTIDLSSCTNLGGTTGDDLVFAGTSGQTITLTIPTATATDGDVVYLQANNTVTLILT